MHPSEQELALLSTGDLSLVARFRVQWHVRSCARCAREVAETRELLTSVRSHADNLPTGVNWDSLAAEMTANIHLGLEAGECVGPTRLKRPEPIAWRTAAAMAGMTLALVGAWWLNPLRESRKPLAMQTPIEIGASQGGIEVKENGSALMLLHTRGQQTPIIVSTPGSLRARFVDQDTGQVTINNVYAD